jgi:hypothetical protein
LVFGENLGNFEVADKGQTNTNSIRVFAFIRGSQSLYAAPAIIFLALETFRHSSNPAIDMARNTT